MNCKEANEVKIVGYLKSLGLDPVSSKGRNFMYRSPLRPDDEPSFKVDPNKNYWLDFGTNEGGTMIDLICKLHKVNVIGALEILSNTSIKKTDFSFHQQNNISEKNIEILHTQALQNRALIEYLTSRFISTQIAFKTPELVEVYYKILDNDRRFFALGFKNDSGGYELRSKYTKACTSKTITTISGNESSLNIFEGFMDYLSALTYFKLNKPNFKTIVLNGVGQTKQILSNLKSFDVINSYIDNDDAGNKAFALIKNENPNAINRSNLIHPECKDFNEFLCKNLRID